MRAFLRGSGFRAVGVIAALGAGLCALAPAAASGNPVHGSTAYGSGHPSTAPASGAAAAPQQAGPAKGAPVTAAPQQAGPAKGAPVSLCTTTITGTVNGGLTVPSGDRYCLIGARVNGTTSVQGGGGVIIEGSTINGGIKSTEGATEVRICGSRVDGTTTIQNGENKILIGADIEDGSTYCPGNVLHGGATITGNRGVIELEDDWITGSLTLIDNEAVAFGGSEAGAEIELTRIAGQLVCQSNSPAPANDGLKDTVTGPELGQCAGL